MAEACLIDELDFNSLLARLQIPTLEDCCYAMLALTGKRVDSLVK